LTARSQYLLSIKDVKLECGYRIDLLVEGRVVVELKSIEGLAAIHEAIILTYLRLSGRRLGAAHQFQRYHSERRD
jgi:GxxExxY protein